MPLLQATEHLNQTPVEKQGINQHPDLFDLSVVAPCYNEMESAPALVERLQKVFLQRGLRGQIVLVNDASTDDTARVLDNLAVEHPNVLALHHAKNTGIAGGWQTGVSHSQGKYVCLIDADLQYLPEEVWRLYREMETSRVDMVQGARSTIGRLKDARYLYSKGLNVLLNSLFGMSLSDNKSGFVIARKETLLDILRHRFNYNYFNTFITVAAVSKGYVVKEVETLFQSRHLGESYIKAFPLKLIWDAFMDIPKAFVEFQLQKERNDLLYHFLQENTPTRPPETYRGLRKLWFELFFMTMPLHKWLISKRAKHYYTMLNQSQWLSAEQIQQLQNQKLQRMVRHIYHHVPYYNELMTRLGLTPEDIQTTEDLAKLPLLTKDDVRNHLYFGLFDVNHKKKDMLKISTSGSTGTPFVTYADKKQLELRWATTLRAAEWTGWRFGDKQARLWHQTLGMSPTQIFREWLDAKLMRRMFVPAFEMREDNLHQLMEQLKRQKPVLIDGYAESFNFLAHYVKTHQINGFRPKAVMSSAQVMPKQVRKIIEEQFGAKVFDKYGSREFSGIAYECEHQTGHHVMAESYIVEILKDNRPALPGETGEVVITDLNNFSVPLIRYRVGDLATAVDNSQPCPCGRGLPRIGEIQGRAQAVILCSNGAWLPGTFFSHFFKDYDYAIRQFQIVQLSQHEVDFKYIPDLQCSLAVLQEIVTHLKTYMGDGMKINVLEVDEIPLVRTGKRTSVVSHLKYDFQDLTDGAETPETVSAD
jgi:phenylacetate-CoA ligase